MNCLLDPHTLLWYLQNSENLSNGATEILEDANNNLYVPRNLLFWQNLYEDAKTPQRNPVSKSRRYGIRNALAIAPQAAKI